MTQKEYKLKSRTYYYPNKGEYIKFMSDELNGHNTYKLLYFFTKDGELGLLDCTQQEPEGLQSITETFDAIAEKYDVPFHKINRLRQDAWRYFADKSNSKNIWHLSKMTGTPFKNKLTDDELRKIKLLAEKELQVAPQKVGYNKWLNLDKKEKNKHMHLFLEHPVAGSDYILHNTFHTDGNSNE